MMQPIDIITCGHLCLDLLPQMGELRLEALAAPGHLFEVGAMDFSTGGSVSNTGLALHRLGVNTRLMATTGDDEIGYLIRSFIQSRGSELIELIRIKAGQKSSYTLVLSPAKVDRMFYQFAGTNAAFNADEIDFARVGQAKILHLGYPPLLPALIADDGIELARLLSLARETGVITSVDMSLPDPNGIGGRADWHALLARCLPFVDIFIPSLDEIMFMLRHEDYQRWRGALPQHISLAYLDALTDELFSLGVSSVVGVKLGEYGLYVRTSGAQRLQQMPIQTDEWQSKRIWHPAFEVTVAGTTGAGDAAYAGFLTALLKGISVETAVEWACAVGACCVEAVDSTSGIQSWDATARRMASGWRALPLQLSER